MPETLVRDKQDAGRVWITRGLALFACVAVLSGCKLGPLPWEPPQTSATPSVPSHGLDSLAQETAPEQAPSPALIAEVQEVLAGLGYRPGPVDGVMGPRTTKAIMSYQETAGLEPTGQVDSRLLAVLRQEQPELAPQAAASAQPVSDPEIPTPAPTLSVDAEALAPPASYRVALPRYVAGSRYVYSDGEVRTVVEVSADQVRWRSNHGTTLVTHVNFMIPPLTWFSSQERGKRTLGVAADSLWPIAPGQQVAFTTRRVVHHGIRSETADHDQEAWRCRNEGREEIELALGTFETGKLVCEQAATSAASAVTRIWHYQPELRHYLRFEELHDGRSQSLIDLVAIQPGGLGWPPAARAGLGWAIQHALDEASPGAESHWTSSAVEAEVAIVAGDTFSWAERRHCRRYHQIWTTKETRAIYPAIACADNAGHWVVPGLEPGELVATGHH